MIRRILSFTILFLHITMGLNAQMMSKRSQLKEAFDLFEKYNPDALQLFDMLKDLPGSYNINNTIVRMRSDHHPEKWLQGNSYKDLMGSINTMVHETHHEFSSVFSLKMLSENPPSDYEFGQNYTAFLLGKDEIELVKHGDIFNSHELRNVIPKSLRTFRYNPYIAPRDRNLGSQVSGIYGLMNEFNAYYHGTLAIMKMYDKYDELAKASVRSWQDYIQHVGHSYSAFYEFKYFILLYLQQAQKKHLSTYEDSMNNIVLRKVYTLVHERYLALIEEFDQQLIDLVNELTAKGIKAEISDGYFWIGGNGVGIMNEDIEALEPILNQPEFIALHNAFLLK